MTPRRPSREGIGRWHGVQMQLHRLYRVYLRCTAELRLDANEAAHVE